MFKRILLASDGSEHAAKATEKPFSWLSLRKTVLFKLFMQ